MKKIYCIYTDSIVAFNLSNPEHIIPLSLGGCNEFVVQVSQIINSKWGSAIDGKMANDFLISLIRGHKSYVGHSRNPAVPTLKNSTFSLMRSSDEGEPAQIRFEKPHLLVYSMRQRRALSPDELKDLTFKSQFKIDLLLGLSFVAKTLLSAGYFVYGGLFKNHADHNSLRNFVTWYVAGANRDIPFEGQLTFVDRFGKVEKKDEGLTGVFKLLCKASADSCVIFLLTETGIIGSVGIGGEYLGSISFKAEASLFPNDEGFRLGRVLVIRNNKIESSYFYDATSAVANDIGITS